MSLTSSERRALQWLLAVCVTGGVVQLTRSWRHEDAVTSESTAALKLQLVAVDSARRAGRRTERRVVRRASSSPRVPPVRKPEQVPTLGPVDVDQAGAAELERLPRIGPALAARIVVDRSERGPFGSLRELQRVRGIGPRMAEGLASVVTFSGTPRPSAVQH